LLDPRRVRIKILPPLSEPLLAPTLHAWPRIPSPLHTPSYRHPASRLSPVHARRQLRELGGGSLRRPHRQGCRDIRVARLPCRRYVGRHRHLLPHLGRAGPPPFSASVARLAAHLSMTHPRIYSAFSNVVIVVDHEDIENRVQRAGGVTHEGAFARSVLAEVLARLAVGFNFGFGTSAYTCRDRRHICTILMVHIVLGGIMVKFKTSRNA
jgi:hypothetical protein